ncbi:hypothetical protein CEXT_770441 [Caerostris extrusa]|uniref:Uncharacterized protein n=1 Tax=Caerostris extrusa TaxID=172846 RepID=A0AAV4VH50_CAEEX|nr:hypothetical protein CEXT_770441 [Caerostris extrusa]
MVAVKHPICISAHPFGGRVRCLEIAGCSVNANSGVADHGKAPHLHFGSSIWGSSEVPAAQTSPALTINTRARQEPLAESSDHLSPRSWSDCPNWLMLRDTLTGGPTVLAPDTQSVDSECCGCLGRRYLTQPPNG